VNESPLQIAPEFTVKVGIAFTVTVETTPVLLTQPDALVPVTV
jgi:preprotein translocase subunit Sec61beta